MPENGEGENGGAREEGPGGGLGYGRGDSGVGEVSGAYVLELIKDEDAVPEADVIDVTPEGFLFGETVANRQLCSGDASEPDGLCRGRPDQFHIGCIRAGIEFDVTGRQRAVVGDGKKSPLIGLVQNIGRVSAGAFHREAGGPDADSESHVRRGTGHGAAEIDGKGIGLDQVCVFLVTGSTGGVKPPAQGKGGGGEEGVRAIADFEHIAGTAQSAAGNVVIKRAIIGSVRRACQSGAVGWFGYNTSRAIMERAGCSVSACRGGRAGRSGGVEIELQDRGGDGGGHGAGKCKGQSADAEQSLRHGLPPRENDCS